MGPERVWIDGVESPGVIPVTDSAVLRGDGCFEVMRAYSGRIFAMDRHLNRLQESAAKLHIDLPDRRLLEQWVIRAALDEPDGAVRVLVSRGSGLPGTEEETKTIVFAHRWEISSDPLTLLPIQAPWHAAGEVWELSGAKVLSYAPNMAARRTARSKGFEDALLIATDGSLLEGPTFSVAWVSDGVIETPTLGLGILDSVTRHTAIQLAKSAGLTVNEGRFDLDRLEMADEVFVMSTIREIQPVHRVGDAEFAPGPTTASLSLQFAQLVGSPADTH